MRIDSIPYSRIELNNCVVSDSSFYICFMDELKRLDWLYKFLNIYTFYIGEKIMDEISNNKEIDEVIVSKLNMFSGYNYYEIIKPYFGRNLKHMKDGEYEAIGIAFYLDNNKLLKYLIIDEQKARYFVETHFPNLVKNLVGTVGYIRDCCCKDRRICGDEAIDILNYMIERLSPNSLSTLTLKVNYWEDT